MTLFITGGSGLLGSHVARNKDHAENVAITYFSRQPPFSSKDWVKLDLRDPQAVTKCFEEVRPERVIHCAATTNLDWCERSPQEAWDHNTAIINNIVKAANRFESHILYVSTDSVFDGYRGLYTEEDIPNPINVYGKIKLAGEKIILGLKDRGLVIRTNFFGMSSLGQRLNLATWIIENLRNKREIQGFKDVYFTPLLANDLSLFLLQLSKKKISGLFHLASSEKISKYEFALKIANAFELDARLIKSSYFEEAGLFTRRPRDTSLKGEKILPFLGKNMPKLDDAIKRFKQFSV